MDVEKSNGYIIKFYKQISSTNYLNLLGNAHFVVWSSFDAMEINNINNFSEFENSPDVCKEEEQVHNRQKLLLLSYLHDEKNIFACGDNSSLNKLPLIAVTMINFGESGTCNCDTNLKKLVNLLNKPLSINGIEITRTDLRWQLFRTVSSYDCVLVLRSNSYYTMDNVLRYLRKSDGINLSKTYTLTGIDSVNSIFWKEPRNTEVSVKISTISDINPEFLASNFELENKNKSILEPTQNCSLYSVFGKYDLNIMGKLYNPKAFLDLFLKGGLFSTENNYIYRTSTQFLCEINSEEDEIKNKIKKQSIDDSAFIKRLDKINNLNFPKSIKSSVNRLALRAHQADLSVYTNNKKQNFNEILDAYIDFFSDNSNMINYLSEIAKIIQSLDLFLDNRISVNVTDFENPHATMRFSGSVSKLIIAYSNFTENLIDLLKFNKETSGSNIKYLQYVTANIGTRLTASSYMPYNDNYRFINIKIPVDFIMELRYMIPWLTHEVGHFMRAGWKRNDRNQACFRSTFRGFIRLIEMYVDKEKIEDNLEPIVPLAYMLNNKDEDEEIDFETHCDCMIRYFIYILSLSAYKGGTKIRIPYNKLSIFIENIKQLCEDMKEAYEESIADIFMIKTLNIVNLSNYLDILKKYYKSCQPSLDNLPVSAGLRIASVSLVLLNVDENTTNIERRNILIQYRNQEKDEDIKHILDLVIEGCYMDCASSLVSFLKNFVVCGLTNLYSKNDKAANMQSKLAKSYKELCDGKGDLDSCFKFIYDYL